MSFIQNFFTSRDNNANSATYVGQQDRIWWDPVTNALYYSDGNTAGGIPVGTAGSGNGVPGGPTNSIQYNAGGGTFGGTANLVVSGTGLVAVGNITAAWFIGNVSTTGNVVAGNVLTNNYLYANGASIFANTTFTGNIDLGNLYIDDQTIGGKNLNANIILLPEGDGWVTVPKIVIENMTIANVGGRIQFDTPANVDLQFDPGTGANILTAGTIKPTSNNIAGLGAADSRYTDLWLGAGNINIIDQTLSQNQQIYADNGNLVIANASGLSFGNFRFYANSMFLANAAANIEIGQTGDTGWVQIDRAFAVTESAGQVAFSVDSDGRTQVRAFDGVPANSAGALNIVASSDGNYQNVTNSGGMIHLTGPENSASRITVDAYGSQGGSGSPSVLVLRAARGNASTPTATQANDITGRVSSLGWGTTFGPSIGGLAPTAMEFVALENYTDTAQGSKITFNTANIGANSRSVSATIQANGVSLLNNTVANSGITFRDGTFQNTAYSPTQVVTSATGATGISISPSTTGNITITNLGVITTAGTANQVFVNGANNISAANGAITLSLPQDIAPGSNVQFYSLTVTDLSITGNVSNVIPDVVDGPIVYVANTATGFGGINNSGLVTGNVANGAWAGILYQTTGAYANTWDLSIGNSVGIYGGNVYGEEGSFLDKLHVGFANATIDFPDASIQADCDVDSYNQVVIMNHNQGANASGDFVAVANNGDNGNFYIDMGINSNVYNNSDYAVTRPNDGYLYVNGGNLIIATETAGKTIEFVTGGMNSTSYVRGTISDSGLSMVGNVTANNFIGNTLSTTGIISAGGNITGNNIFSLNVVSAAGNITGQNLLTTGVVSATGNIQGGNLRTTGSISATGNIRGGNLITATTVINNGVSTSGNITGANILTGGTVSATGNINGANIIANLAVIGSVLSILGNIEGGNLLTSGVISTTGNAVFGNVSTAGRVIATGNVDAGNLRTVGLVTATGNVSTAGFFIGDGGFISNLTIPTPTKIVNGTSWANIATSGSNLVVAIAGGTVATISTGGANITGYANVSGNVSGGNLIGQNLTPTRVTFVGSGKEIDDDAEFTYNDTTNTLSVGNITATGNVNAAFFNGNGSGLTGTVGGSRYFGSFLSTTTQTNTSPGNALPMTFDTADAFNSGVRLGSPTPNSQVIINNPGVYNLQFSAQLDKTDAGADTVDIWLSQDGVNVPNTNTVLTLTGNDDKVVAAWNFLIQTTTANSYFQLYWTSIDANLRILAQGTQISPTRPATPAIILTVTQA
jgi:hypothetical protein